MANDIEDCVLAARAELQLARQLLNTEIRDYPTPIAGCDVQFNHLLAERRRVTAALQSLGSEVFVPTPRSLTPGTGVESR